MIGHTLSHYRVIRQLGAGGMGEVFLAEDSRLERRVAIKILPPELSDNTARRSRFEAEAKAASAINHPNITGCHGVLDRGEALERSMDAVAQALEIDPNLAEALAASAERKYLFECDELERAVDRHSMLAAFMPGMPAYDMPELADDPRFQQLMDRTGFTRSGVPGGDAR